MNNPQTVKRLTPEGLEFFHCSFENIEPLDQERVKEKRIISNDDFGKTYKHEQERNDFLKSSAVKNDKCHVHKVMPIHTCANT